jgi:hypothetical protein
MEAQMNEPRDATPLQAPLEQLERALIDEFLQARGLDASALAALPERERELLLKEASVNASGRLAEVESRSHFVHDLAHPE